MSTFAAAWLVFAVNIEAGPADTQLNALLRQTHMSGVWDLADTQSRSVKALHGKYTLEGAWCAILEGTGLTFRVRGKFIDLYVERYQGELRKECPKPEGWGPDFIHPPQVNWK